MHGTRRLHQVDAQRKHQDYVLAHSQGRLTLAGHGDPLEVQRKADREILSWLGVDAP